MSLLEKAQLIATTSHHEQTDKAGKPYIGHALRVMAKGRTAEEKIVGVLHDVLEDTSITMEDLAREGFPEPILSALRCITKTTEDRSYDAFIERCATNPLAVAVKVHDLRDNMDITRMENLDDHSVERLRRYLRAYKRLMPLYERMGGVSLADEEGVGEMYKSAKRILYVDMDGVLVDFKGGIDTVDSDTRKEYEGRLKDIPGLFSRMKPIPGAVESYCTLARLFDTYILSTAPWNNATALDEKKAWVKQYLGDVATKRLILSHHKNLCRGDFLIDDRTVKGAGEFEGELILFGTERFPGWKKTFIGQ